MVFYISDVIIVIIIIKVEKHNNNNYCWCNILHHFTS